MKGPPPPAGALAHPPLGKLEAPIVVTAHGLHGRDPRQLREGVERPDVAGVEDHVDAREKLGDALGETFEELRAMGVGNHPDPGFFHMAKCSLPMFYKVALTN